MIKVNEYLEGKVKSLGAEYKGEYFTAGVMLPGEYKFSTEKEEHIVVTLGELRASGSRRTLEEIFAGGNRDCPRQGGISAARSGNGCLRLFL